MAKRVISAVLKFKDENFSSGLRKANSEAGDFGRSMNVVQNKVENFKQSATRAFQAIGTAATALGATGLTLLGASVTQAVIEMDSAFGKLSAQTGAVGHELEEYRAIAKDVFVKGFGESITEASNAVGKFANMFKDLDYGELSTVTEGSFTIAKAFDQEATEVGRAVKAMLTNFDNLSASGATDLITVAFQKTGDYANDLLDTVSEYSGYFSDVGMSAEQFTSTLIKGAEAGAWNIDKVGDAVKEFSILSIDGSKSTAEGFAAIGLNADDMASKIAQGGETANQAYMATVAGLAAMKDPVKRNAAGVALFGTMWEDLRDDVVIAMSDSTSAVEGYQGATAAAADALNSGPIARMKNAWRDLTVQLASLGSDGSAKTFLDGLATTTENMGPKIVDLAEKAMVFGNTIRDNWGPIKETVIGITTAVVAFKVGMMAMTIVSTVANFMKAYRAALAAGTVAQWAMNVAMSANPVGLVIAGIAALIGIGVVLYRNWDTVKEKASQLWSKLQDNPFAAIVAGPFGLIIGAAVTLYKNFDKVKSTFSKLSSAIKNFKPPEWITKIGGAVSGAYNKVKNFIDGSHATGLNRVPFDGYIAELHKDEMVLPARQAAKIRDAGGDVNNVGKTLNKNNNQGVKFTSTGGGNTFTFGNIIIQGVEGTTEAVQEFMRQVKLALANM